MINKMITQNEITTQQDLLDAHGSIINPGWARKLLWNYHRAQIKAPVFRIKEWDYYCILAQNHGVAFTVADNGYMGFLAATVFDFVKKTEYSASKITPFPMGKFLMPETSEIGNIMLDTKKIKIQYKRLPGKRILQVNWQQFRLNDSLSAEIELAQPENMDSMVIATPFDKNKKAFYYNQKINCMPAKGNFQLGAIKEEFLPETDFGVLDWGRGVWTYNNTWYWGSASGLVNNEPFGFNIGYGFGNTSAATENMLFYKGKAHKLEQVNFLIPEDSFLKTWKFTSNNQRFELDFVPILDRASNTNLGIILSDQHQVFGRFYGKVILDDNQTLNIDGLLGFAEKVKNKW